MAIAIRPVGERFMVELTPPHGYWRSPDPLAPTDVIARLAELGCHSTDVTDALGFGEQTWMVAPGTLEEVGEFSDVLDARLCVAVAACRTQ